MRSAALFPFSAGASAAGPGSSQTLACRRPLTLLVAGTTVCALLYIAASLTSSLLTITAAQESDIGARAGEISSRHDRAAGLRLPLARAIVSVSAPTPAVPLTLAAGQLTRQEFESLRSALLELAQRVNTMESSARQRPAFAAPPAVIPAVSMTTALASVPTPSVAPTGKTASITISISTGSGSGRAITDHARPQQPTSNPTPTPQAHASVAPLPPINAPALLQCAPFLARHADFAVAPNAAAALHTDATARVQAAQIGRAANAFPSVRFAMSTHRTSDIVSGEIRQSGIWEPWTLAVLSAALDTMTLVAPAAASSAAHRIDFIDIGANVGFFTSFIAAYAPRARVLAIEPFEMNTKVLMRTKCVLNPLWSKPLPVAASGDGSNRSGASINSAPGAAAPTESAAGGLTTSADATRTADDSAPANAKVSLYRAALSDAAGVDMCMWSTHDGINRGNARMTRTFTGRRTFDQDEDKECKERFATSTLDRVLFEAADGPRLVDGAVPVATSAASGLHASKVPLAASPRIRALKIDVEGFETMALRGASRLLRGPLAPCYIVFEYQRVPTVTSGAGALELFALLRAAGYQLYLRGPAIGGAKLIRADADAATCATTLCDFAAYLTRHEDECGVRSNLLVDA